MIGTSVLKLFENFGSPWLQQTNARLFLLFGTEEITNLKERNRYRTAQRHSRDVRMAHETDKMGGRGVRFGEAPFAFHGLVRDVFVQRTRIR